MVCSLPPSAETWIGVHETAALLQIKPLTVVRRIQNGKIIGRCDEASAEGSLSPDAYSVLLNGLPFARQQQYWEARFPENQLLSLDILSIRESRGNRSEEHYLKSIQMFLEAARIRKTHAQDGTITKQLERLAHKHCISIRTLYRYEAVPEIQAATPLFLDPVYWSKHMPKTICLLAIDLVFTLWLDPDHRLAQNAILRQTQALAPKMACAHCPYFAGSDSRSQLATPIQAQCPECQLSSEHMLVPGNRHVINRLLSRIPEQQLCYCREGVRSWRARFGHFAVREKPLNVNACFQGDHHVFDLFVDHVSSDSRGKKRHFLIRPVLTAWMDTASGCIVGWVISFLPNSDTIADAFSRAAAFTAGDEFAGLPASVYVDCGKDYSSALLQDLDPDLRNCVHPSERLNAALVGNALFAALNITVHKALPYHPQSKSIERFFGTLESTYIAPLPGWCGNSIAKRPPDFHRKVHRLQNEGKLFSLASFSQYFASVILPDYHHTIPENAPDGLSPIERYRKLPKARDLVPSWKTMAVLKSRRDYYTVQRQGIRCQNTFYWADALDPYVGCRLLVYYSEALPPMSITVLLNGHYLCEAYPVEPLPFVDADPDRLQAHLDAQARQQKKMRAPITRLKRIMRVSGLAEAMSAKDALRMEAFGQTIDDVRDCQATDLLPEIPDDAPTPSGTYSSQQTTSTEEYLKLQQLLNPME